jgi:hypothetical protein
MKPVSIIFLLCSFAFVVSGQDSDDWYGRKTTQLKGSFYGEMGVGMNAFGRNMDRRTGFGLGGEFLVNLQRNGPVWAGVGIHSFAFDRDRLAYTQEFDGVIYNYEDLTVSRAFMAHGILRFQPEVDFFLKPYIQGGAGVHWLFTNTKIEDTDYDEEIEQINESRDASWGFTIQGGIEWSAKSFDAFRIDLRGGYFHNASVQYLRYNPNANGIFPIDFFESRTSPVDLLGIQLGVVFLISSVE